MMSNAAKQNIGTFQINKIRNKIAWNLYLKEGCCMSVPLTAITTNSAQ